MEEQLITFATQVLLQKWLREKHKLVVIILPYQDYDNSTPLCWYYSIVNFNETSEDKVWYNGDVGNNGEFFDTYEECLENALQKSLLLINE